MKKLTLALAALFALATWTFAGPERYSGKEMKQVAPPPCPEFYADFEWDIGLWGAYAFSNNDNNDNNFFDDHPLFFFDGEVVDFNNNNGINGDGGGGGIDIKYFFYRYFGVGIEAFGLATGNNNNDDHDNAFLHAFGIDEHNNDNNNGVGAVLGTFTLRYPFHCSHFSPYLFAGGGVIFGNGDNNDDSFVFVAALGQFVRRHGDDNNNNNDAHGIGQVGGGLEIRFTPHIGWITDGSWNFTGDGDFGMVRGGLNFAF